MPMIVPNIVPNTPVQKIKRVPSIVPPIRLPKRMPVTHRTVISTWLQPPKTAALKAARNMPGQQRIIAVPIIVLNTVATWPTAVAAPNVAKSRSEFSV